jgi:hypothetical protein
LDKKAFLFMLVGLALRLALVFPGPLASKVEFLSNKADLRNYYWPAQAVLKGENPYTLWASGASGEFRADMAPLELAVYVATVSIWNDPRSIQLLFAAFDTANIFLLGLVLANSPLRMPFQVFYALGPLTIYNLVLVPEDKTIVLALTLLVFFFLLEPRDRTLGWRSWRVGAPALAVTAGAILASFKWLSVFYLVPLLFYTSRGVREWFKHALLFGGIVAASHLPWAPSWMIVYTFRSARVATPIHIAPAVLANAVGWFDRNLLLLALIGSLLVIYGLFWLERIDIFETIALSTGAGILWTPDMDPVHLSIVVLSFLLVVNWVRSRRWLLVWSLSFWVAAVYAASTRVGWSRYGWPDLQQLSGPYGSIQMILESYALIIVVLGLYLVDKWRGSPVGSAVLTAGVGRS